MDIFHGNNAQQYPQAGKDPGITQDLPQRVGEITGGIDARQRGGYGQRREMEGDTNAGCPGQQPQT